MIHSTLIVFALFLLGCAQGSPFNGEAGETRLNSADVSVMKSAPKENSDALPVFAGEYEIRVAAIEDDREICIGRFDGVVWSDQNFVPKGTMECTLKGSVDLAESFPNISTEAMKDYPEYGMINRLKNPDGMGTTLNPPRVAGLALVQDHTEFENFAITEHIELTYSDAEGDQFDSGDYTYRVAAINQQETIESGEIFDNVILTEITSTGFDTVPKNLTNIETKRKLWQNTRPGGLIRVQIDSTLPDRFPGLASELGDLLFGPIQITITLKKTRPLTEADYPVKE